MATNAFENTDLVVRETVQKMENYLTCANYVDRGLEDAFTGKVGASIEKRRPYYFVATDGAVASASDIEEGTVTITVDKRKNIALEISSQELALDIDDARIQKLIDAAAQELAQNVETSIMTEGYKGIYGYSDESSGLTLDAIADADAYLDGIGVSMMDARYMVVTPASKRVIAKDIATDFAFPSTQTVSDAMRRAKVGEYSNVNVMQGQSVSTHTSGVATGTPLVNGASQNVTYSAAKNSWTQSLITDGWTNSTADILVEGDTFTIAGVYAINKGTKAALADLQSFVVTADVASGASTGPATLTISPPIISSGAYQTVSAAPADNAAITVLSGASQSRKENLVFNKDCINLTMVELPAIKKGAISSSTVGDKTTGISVRVTHDYDSTNDLILMRFDILYGVTVQAPWAGYRLATAV